MLLYLICSLWLGCACFFHQHLLGVSVCVDLYFQRQKQRKNYDTENDFCFESSLQVALKSNWMCFGKTIRMRSQCLRSLFSLCGRFCTGELNWRKKEKIDRKLLILNEVHKYYFVIERYCVNECARSTTRSDLIARICGFGSCGMQLKCFSSIEAVHKKNWRADYFECWFETLQSNFFFSSLPNAFEWYVHMGTWTAIIYRLF